MRYFYDNQVNFDSRFPQAQDIDPFADTRSQPIANREDQYRQQRLNRVISPARNDPFADGGKTPDPSLVQYKDIMMYQVIVYNTKGIFEMYQN